MNQYDGLLSKVSQRYHIFKGIQESETDWKVRLVYTICGLMGYASLWDEAEGPVTMEHLTTRVGTTLANYKTLYPELSNSLPYHQQELEAEIEGLFEKAGVVYHCPYRVAPSMRREEGTGPLLFQRGIAVDSIARVSGVGLYAKQDQGQEPGDLKAMFGLEAEHLQTSWETAVAGARWQPAPMFEQELEYLRLNPPFSRGYWMNHPDKTGGVSILRTQTKGTKLYYLYRFQGEAMEVSPLPPWQVEGHEYRALACGCLWAHGTLPPIEYEKDGDLVHLRMNYLLPPRELAFLKLYSWPESCVSLPCDFRRKLSAEVFDAIKSILSEEGYQFEGGAL